MRLVIDSNIWISALVFGGQPRRVFELIVRDGHTIVLSREISAEVRRILKRKFPGFAEDFEDLLVALESRIEHVVLGEIMVNVSRDSDDNMVIETALAGEASHIVSGDQDLLCLEAHEGVIMTTASAMLKVFEI